jgi:tetratricopeptide (TPR) repeat protein
MRKYIILVCLFLSFYFFTNAQISDELAWRKVDSVNKVIKTTKGKNRVDCYNLLAECYLQIWDEDHQKELDTACMYANNAYVEAKKINYPTGIGYAKMALISRAIAKIDDNKNNNDTEPAYIETCKLAQEVLTLADQIKDDYLAGVVYGNLIWVEKWKGTQDKFKQNVQKAIQRFEKVGGNNFKNSFRPFGCSNCPGCKGTEGALAGLHGDLAVIFSRENNPHAKDELNLAIHYYSMIGNNKNQLGREYLQLARAYFFNYDYKSSEQAYLQAKEYFHETGDVEDEIGQLNEMSNIYELRGDFENGITAFKNSIKLIEDYFKDKASGSAKKRSAVLAFSKMARLYMIAGDYEEALDIIRQGRQYYPANRDSVFIEPWLSAIGDAYRLLGNYDSAMYYLKGFQNAPNYEPNNFGNGKVSLGYLYLDLKEYTKALSLSLPFSQNLKNINRITPPIVNMLMIAGNASLGEKKYEQALQYAKEAQAYLVQMDGRVLMISNYKLLSEIYDKINKPDSAYAYLKLYTILKDSLINRQFYFKLNSLKNESEEQKKTSQINLLNKDNQLKDQKLKQQATVRNSLIGGLVLLFLLALFIFRTLSLKRKKERAELQKKATDLEMQALRAQINPHFIFNCLSSINKFILKNDTDAASDYLTRFSRLIRMVLTNSQLSLLPLSDEIEMLRLYLDMERLRFSNSFDYNIIYANTIEPETIYIPPMLLQPFCENAIWHGLMQKEGQGKLEIMMSKDENELECVITDNGIGRKRASELSTRSGTKQKSLGLKITTERLALFNNERTGNSFFRSEDILDENGTVAGTKVLLKIRFRHSLHQLVKETV